MSQKLNNAEINDSTYILNKRQQTRRNVMRSVQEEVYKKCTTQINVAVAQSNIIKRQCKQEINDELLH